MHHLERLGSIEDKVQTDIGSHIKNNDGFIKSYIEECRDIKKISNIWIMCLVEREEYDTKIIEYIFGNVIEKTFYV